MSQDFDKKSGPVCAQEPTALSTPGLRQSADDFRANQAAVCREAPSIQEISRELTLRTAGERAGAAAVGIRNSFVDSASGRDTETGPVQPDEGRAVREARELLVEEIVPRVRATIGWVAQSVKDLLGIGPSRIERIKAAGTRSGKVAAKYLRFEIRRETDAETAPDTEV